MIGCLHWSCIYVLQLRLYGICSRVVLKSATVNNLDLLQRLSATGAAALHLLDDIHTVADFSEDYVFAVQPGAWNSGDEELATVGVGAAVGH